MPSVDLTPDKLAELKKKAKAAEGVAPSPWTFSHTSGEYRFFYEVCDSGDYQVVYDMSVEEGEHIAAADPATVLAMVEEIERHAEDIHLVKMTFLGFLRHQVDKSISTDDLLKIASNMLEKTSEIIKQESEAGQ